MATKKSGVKKSAPKKVIKKAAPKKVVTKAAPKKAVKKTVSKKAVKKKTPSKAKALVKAISGKHVIARLDGQQMIDTFMYYNNPKKITGISFSSGREFDISLFTTLLSLPNIKKIRFRNAVNANNEHTLVITGVNANGFDILIPVADSTTQSSALTGDDPPPTDGMGDMGDQCTDPKYKP